MSAIAEDKFHFENLLFCDKVSLDDYETKYKETEDLDYLYYKCQHLVDLGEYEMTIKLLTRIKEINRDTDTSSRYLACLLKLEFFKGNFFHCKTIWNQIVEDDERFSDKWLHLEYVRFLYHFESPYLENVLDDLLQNHPTFLPAILMKTEILINLSKNNEALKYFDPYLSRNPECISLEACNIIASCYLALNDPASAKGWISKSFAILESSDAYTLKGLYLEQVNSDTDKIIEAYQKAFELDGYNLDAFLNLSSTLKQYKKEEKLINFLESIKVTELDQQNIAIGVLASYLLYVNKEKATLYTEEIKELFTEEDIDQISEFIDSYEKDNELFSEHGEGIVAFFQECVLSLRIN